MLRSNVYSFERPRSLQSEEEGFDRVPDLVCFSPLRWAFMFQRLQHLMVRFAKERRVFFIEEPVFGSAGDIPRIDSSADPSGVCVVVPHLPAGMSQEAIERATLPLIADFARECSIGDCVLWFYTSTALPLARAFHPLATVYDGMDESRAPRSY